MQFVPYILSRENDSIPVQIEPMKMQDAMETQKEPAWQSDWTSDAVNQKRYLNYAVKVKGELVALGCYEILENILLVHIRYIEAQPQSNPVMTKKGRKYHGIGRLLIAYGIKLSIDYGFGGDVTFEAKTSELEQHYIRDFGAVKIPTFEASAPRLMIADEAARVLFADYLQ